VTNEIKSGLQTFEERAVLLVGDYLESNSPVVINRDQIRVVWFCKTLQNWKAMVAHLAPGGMFFEVTHNGDKKETYIDVYLKSQNVCIPD